MTWTVLITLLTLAVGIQGRFERTYNTRYPECDGTKPWSVEDVRENGYAIIFISREIDGHLRRFQDGLSDAYEDTRKLEYYVKLMYTNSTIETDWSKISGVSQEQAEACHDLISELTRERMKLIIRLKDLEYKFFERQYSKVQNIFLAWEGRNRRNESSNALAKAKEVYANVCKESGTATARLMEINRSFDINESRYLDPAKECYELVKEQPRADIDKKQETP